MSWRRLSWISFKSAKSLNNKIVDPLFLYEKNKSKAELSPGKFLQPSLKPIVTPVSF